MQKCFHSIDFTSGVYMEVFFAPPPDFGLQRIAYSTPHITQKEYDECTRTFTDIAIMIILALAVVLSLGTVLLVDEVKDAFSRLFTDDKKPELGPRPHTAIPKPTQRDDYWKPLAAPLPTDEELDCTRTQMPRPITPSLLDRSAQDILEPHLKAIFAKPQGGNESLARAPGVKFFKRKGTLRVFTLTKCPNVIFKMYTDPRRTQALRREARNIDNARRICSELGLTSLSIPHSTCRTIRFHGRYYEVLIQNKLLLPTPGKQKHALKSDSSSLNAPIKDLTTLMCEGRFIHFSPARQSPLIGSRAIGIINCRDDDTLPLAEELNTLHSSVGASQKRIVETVARSYGYKKTDRGFIGEGTSPREPHRRSACAQVHTTTIQQKPAISRAATTDQRRAPTSSTKAAKLATAHSSARQTTELPGYWQPLLIDFPRDEELKCAHYIPVREYMLESARPVSQEILQHHVRNIMAHPYVETSHLSFTRRIGSWRVFNISGNRDCTYKFYTSQKREKDLIRRWENIREARTICSNLNLTTLYIPDCKRMEVSCDGKTYKVLAHKTVNHSTNNRADYKSDVPRHLTKIKHLATFMCETRTLGFNIDSTPTLDMNRRIALLSLGGNRATPLANQLDGLYNAVGVKGKEIVFEVAKCYGFTLVGGHFSAERFNPSNPIRRSAFPAYWKQKYNM